LDTYKIILILLAVLAVLFMPFYPFRMATRLVLTLLNILLPLPIKFDDIGGIPLIGIRLFNVRIALKGESSLVAREMRIRINLLNVLVLRRPTIDPVVFYDPVIHLFREKEQGELWFLFPINIARRVVGLMFGHAMGTNKVYIVNGRIVLHGAKGDTEITDMEGLFVSQGSGATVRSLDCRIGQGRLQLTPVGPAYDSDITITAHELPLEKLAALKIPEQLTGQVRIDAVMRGGFGPPVIDGDLKASVIYMREQAIRNFSAPLHFEGTTLTLSPMRGDVADYLLTGSLDSDVVTDRVVLKLHGTGSGRGPGNIFQMLNMKPYIQSAQFDGRIDLEGEFEDFTDITGAIDIKLRDVRLNPEAFTMEGNTPSTSMPRVPILNFDMFMQEGSLYIDSVQAWLPGSFVRIGGRVDMTLDKELDKVTDTVYDFSATVKDDATISIGVDPKATLTLPLEFKGKLRLNTHQTDDSKDFKASGRVDMSDIVVQKEAFRFLGNLNRYIDVAFRSLNGEMDITADRIKLSNVHVAGRWMDFWVDGLVGLDGRLDLRAYLKVLSRDQVQDGAGLFRLLPDMISNRLKSGLHITGTTSRPRVRLMMGEEKHDVLPAALNQGGDGADADA
jgi:hypothetical protein